MIATLLVLLPMLSAAAAYPLGRKTERGVNALLIASTGLELLLALGLFFFPAAAEAPGFCGEGMHLVSVQGRNILRAGLVEPVREGDEPAEVPPGTDFPDRILHRVCKDTYFPRIKES